MGEHSRHAFTSPPNPSLLNPSYPHSLYDRIDRHKPQQALSEKSPPLQASAKKEYRFYLAWLAGDYFELENLTRLHTLTLHSSRNTPERKEGRKEGRDERRGGGEGCTSQDRSKRLALPDEEGAWSYRCC